MRLDGIWTDTALLQLGETIPLSCKKLSSELWVYLRKRSRKSRQRHRRQQIPRDTHQRSTPRSLSLRRFQLHPRPVAMAFRDSHFLVSLFPVHRALGYLLGSLPAHLAELRQSSILASPSRCRWPCPPFNSHSSHLRDGPIKLVICMA